MGEGSCPTAAGIQNTRNARNEKHLPQSLKRGIITVWRTFFHSNKRSRKWFATATTVALEGFTHLIPFAAGHEIIRQGRRNLTVIRMTPDLIYDQLIGAGCVSKLRFLVGR